MQCLTFEGLGNRINAIASALTATKRTRETIHLTWAINKHLPMAFEDVFRPIQRIEARSVYAQRFAYSQTWNRLCYYYASNPRNLRKGYPCAMRDNYLVVLNAMKIGKPQASGDLAGLHYRAFMPETPSLSDYIERAKQWAPDCRLFIASNCEKSRDKIAAAFPGSVVADDAGQTADFDRSQQSVIQWADCLKTFARCNRGILSSTKRSTALDSVRGYRVRVEYVHESDHHRNEHLERLINA